MSDKEANKSNRILKPQSQESQPQAPQQQVPQGIWALVKSKVSAIMEHRFFDKWVMIVRLLLAAAGLVGVSKWYCKISSSSGPNSPSISGDNNTVAIVSNAYSTQDIEKMITAAMAKASITDAVAASASPQDKPIPQLLNSSELDFLASNAFNAWKRMDFSNAVMNARCADKLIASHFPKDGGAINIYIESNVWLNAHRVYPVLIDDAMSNEDYDGMSRMADILIASTPSYWAYPQAMKDIANLRKTGRRLFFFSAEEVCKLRRMPKRELEQYLTLLTTRGYLAPYSLNYRSKDVEPLEWGEFFDLGHALPYLDAFRVKTRNKDGDEITSNELYGQWVGLGKCELVDVNEEAARAMGLPESQTPRRRIRLTGTIMRGRPLAVARAENLRVKVPEPSSGMLLLVGLAVIAMRRRRTTASP